MIRSRKVLIRRDATVNRVPFYPDSIHGAVVRTQLTMAGKHSEVTQQDRLWGMWLLKLTSNKLLIQVSDGHYARPRCAQDFQHTYKRKRKSQMRPGPTLRAEISRALSAVRRQMLMGRAGAKTSNEAPQMRS